MITTHLADSIYQGLVTMSALQLRIVTLSLLLVAITSLSTDRSTLRTNSAFTDSTEMTTDSKTEMPSDPKTEMTSDSKTEMTSDTITDMTTGTKTDLTTDSKTELITEGNHPTTDSMTDGTGQPSQDSKIPAAAKKVNSDTCM